MTWLHMLFGLFFVQTNCQAKLAHQLKTTVLLFLPLYFSWFCPSKRYANFNTGFFVVLVTIFDTFGLLVVVESLVVGLSIGN